MDPEEPTKKCPTCERDIPESKFRLHEIPCARNNYKCAECGEIVAKAEKEEHEKEAHAEVGGRKFDFLGKMPVLWLGSSEEVLWRP